MKTKLLVIAIFAATTGLVLGLPASTPPATPVVAAQPRVAPAVQRPRVEAVFVLDTTGSMSGLIDAAKENIWSIASSMAQAQPTPELRIGLVAFRDRGDAYVTRRIALSGDLDSMYAQLMELRAEGGGDSPESVQQALHEAVTQMDWSEGADAYRTVFLVGDAPAHTDYPDDVPYEQTLRLAAQRGIVVNTLQAGQDAGTAAEWQRIAALSQGRYLQVGQGGDRIAVATPFDDEIATLSQQLDDTRLYFGGEEAQREAAGKQAATAKLHAEGSTAARAKRALFNVSAGGKDNALGENELIAAVSSGRVDLDALEGAELPAPLRELAPELRQQKIEELAERRSELNAKIGQLAAQRRDYVESQVDKELAAASLDYQLYDTIKAQGEAKGLRYAAEPVN